MIHAIMNNRPDVLAWFVVKSDTVADHLPLALMLKDLSFQATNAKRNPTAELIFWN